MYCKGSAGFRYKISSLLDLFRINSQPRKLGTVEAFGENRLLLTQVELELQCIPFPC